LVAYSSLTSSITDVAFRDVDGTVRFYAGTNKGDVVKVGTGYEGATSFKRLNWREIPTAD
jgi:type IV pilus assembly protein PilY1